MATKGWAIDPKKTGSINDGGRKLKIGAFAYKIISAKSEVVKSNPTGKEQQVVFELDNKGYVCKIYLPIMNDNDITAEIAAKTLTAIADAAGITGILKPERLKLFIGKFVVIEARENAGKGENKGKTFVNIATVEAYDPENDPEDQDEEEEDEEEDEEEEDEEEEEEDEEEEAPPAKPAKKPSKKPAPEPEPEEEEEDEEEEEEEEDEEEEEEEKTPPPAKKPKKPSAAARFAAEDAAKAPKKPRPWT